MAFRYNVTGSDELKQIAIAYVVLTVALSLALSGGIFGIGSSRTGVLDLILIMPIAAFAVFLSFVLHELMHKFVAQHYGAVAGFAASTPGLMITFMTGALGFLFGLPGATMIYASHFTRKENGLVALAGPMTNFAVFTFFIILFFVLNPAQNSYQYFAIVYTVFISTILAFYNMLPMPPLDGSKVLGWNRGVYVIMFALVFAPIIYLIYIGLMSLFTLGYMIFIALIFSLFYRRVLY